MQQPLPPLLCSSYVVIYGSDYTANLLSETLYLTDDFIPHFAIGGEMVPVEARWDQASLSCSVHGRAALSRSSHGRAYLNGTLVGGQPAYECNSCIGHPWPINELGLPL